MTQATHHYSRNHGMHGSASVSASMAEMPVLPPVVQEDSARAAKDPWKRRLNTKSGRIFIGATCGVAVGAVMTLAQMVMSVPGFTLNTALASILGIAVLGGLHGLAILSIPARKRAVHIPQRPPAAEQKIPAKTPSPAMPPKEARTHRQITPEELARMDSPSPLLH